MTKQTYEDLRDNQRTAFNSRQKALEQAQARLKREGIEYPSPTGMTHLEHYDAVLAYGQKESQYMLQFLKQPSGPRPIVEIPPRKDWTNRYD